MPPILDVSGLAFRFRETDVLRGVSFDVQEGEILCLIGPNGAGKTTLLRLLTHVLKPMRGVVRYRGTDLHGMASDAVARMVAFVSQSQSWMFPMTVRAMVLLGRHPWVRGAGFETPADDDAVDRAMTLLGIETLAHRRVTELSGGEQQRVAIARALAQDTPVLLLDEPTAHLDLRHQLDVFGVLRDLSRREHRTAVCVMHDINLAAAFADRIALLSDGVLLACGRPVEVLTADRVRQAYGVEAHVVVDPRTGRPRVEPAALSRS